MRIVFSLEKLREAELAKHSHLKLENAPWAHGVHTKWDGDLFVTSEERWQPHTRSLQMAVLPRKVNSLPNRWWQRPKSEQEKETQWNTFRFILSSKINQIDVLWFYDVLWCSMILRCPFWFFVSEETSLVRVEGRILGNVVRWAGTTWRIPHSCLNHLGTTCETVKTRNSGVLQRISVARLKSSHSKFMFFSLSLSLYKSYKQSKNTMTTNNSFSWNYQWLCDFLTQSWEPLTKTQ